MLVGVGGMCGVGLWGAFLVVRIEERVLIIQHARPCTDRQRAVCRIRPLLATRRCAVAHGVRTYASPLQTFTRSTTAWAGTKTRRCASWMWHWGRLKGTVRCAWPRIACDCMLCILDVALGAAEGDCKVGAAGC